jgi:hypothetical protein
MTLKNLFHFLGVPNSALIFWEIKNDIKLLLLAIKVFMDQKHLTIFSNKKLLQISKKSQKQ